MKATFILLSILCSLSSSNLIFLRELVSVTTVNFGKICVTVLDNTLEVTLGLDQALKKNDKIEAKLIPDVKDPQSTNTFEFSYTESTENASATTIIMKTNSTSKAIEGTYKLKEGKITQNNQTTDLPFPSNSLKYISEFVLAPNQITSQEIDSSRGDKKSFVVTFFAPFSETPKIYTGIDSQKEIKCTPTQDNKSVNCIPTTANMEEGKSYTIAYQKACDGDKASTGITVKATKLTNSTTGSQYMKISQIIILAVLIML